MKKSHILSAAIALSVLSVLTSTTPAAALNVGAYIEGNASTSASHGRDDNSGHDMNDDHGDDNRGNDNASMHTMIDARLSAAMNHWKTWSFINNGIMGTVTAKNGDTITVKGTNGTTYTVNTANANIRTSSGSSIETNDHVYVQGAINGSTVVATLVIDGKAGNATPTNDDKRMAVWGTVTAQSGNTITVVGNNGTTYTVAAGNASIWKSGHQNSSVSDIDVGDSIVVQGTVSGSSVTATKVYAVTFPDTTANGGIHGTVTAVNDDTITIMAPGGTTYHVDTSDADFKDHKGDNESMSDVHVGEMVTVNGDVDGSSIDASTVSEATVHQGFFVGIGNFFKHLFGKKGSQ